MDSKVETIPLPVKLTETEVPERSRELAAEIATHDEVQRQQKQSAKAFKDRVDTHEARIRELGATVKTGEEMRPIECEWHADMGKRVMTLIRSDTYAVVRSRPMTDDELQEASQGQFPFVDQPRRRAPKAQGEA